MRYIKCNALRKNNVFEQMLRRNEPLLTKFLINMERFPSCMVCKKAVHRAE